MATISLRDFGKKIANVTICLDDPSWKIPALKLGEGLMKVRIFQKGQASDGSGLGAYRSASHAAARKSKGRQVGYKDLFFNGDLNRALTVGENDGEPVLGLATDKARLIMVGQEAQTKKKISTATDETAKKIAKSAANNLAKCIEKALKI